MFNRSLNVLVFPCGSEIGLEIHSSLQLTKGINLIGASSVDDHGSFVYMNHFAHFPNVSEERFISYIKEFIQKEEIDVLIPAHDSVVLKLSEYAADLPCTVISSEYETCRICRSKATTYNFLSDSVNVPRQYDLRSIKKTKVNFPLFLKPDVGQGSKGTHIVYSASELNFFLQQSPDLLILEYLPGEEYTVECFTDRLGHLLVTNARIRSRVSNGISVRTTPINDPQITDIARTINNKLCFRGAWFFQLKKDRNDNYSLLEVAPRIPGSSGLYRALGYNYTLMSILDRFGAEIRTINYLPNIVMDRALTSRYKIDIDYDTIYLDYDDTLVINGKLNVSLLTFLAQALNENKKIVLLTRHNSRHPTDIFEELKRYRVLDFFAEVINVEDNEMKSKYTKCASAIFIDDSFTERHEVFNQSGIPVFSPESVICLLHS